MKKSKRNAFWIFGLTLSAALAIYLALPNRSVQLQELESPGAVFMVTSNADSGAGSLRQAITDANAAAGTDTIQFQIGTGAVNINLSSVLPDVTEPVIIDGTTQPGFSGTPLINLVGGFDGGLKITGGGSTVKAIAVTSSTLGITLAGGGGNTITGCSIGICPQNPTAICGNFASGISVNNSPNNQIGGSTAATRNIISGNSTNGIEINGAASGGNIITGNYIGLRPDGTVARNNGSGIAITGAPNNRVGGTKPAERNIVSGNGQGSDLPGNQIKSAVLITGAEASGNTVEGNYIGTTIDGTAAVSGGSRLNGVRIEDAPNNRVGGTVGTTPDGACTGACNVISGISFRGGVIVTGSGATGNTIAGNFIGTNAAGTASISNNVGVTITNAASNNTVGGTVPQARNLITDGMILMAGASGNTVEGNYIGTDTTGNTGLGRGTLLSFFLVAVGIDSSANNRIGTVTGTTLGGACTGGCNLISGHLAAHGVFITGAGSTANRVDYNYIGLNAAGTAALRNGGDAITLRDGANNNIIGRPLPTPTPFQETKQSENIPSGTIIVQDDLTGNYISFDGTPGIRQATAKICRNSAEPISELGEVFQRGTVLHFISPRIRASVEPASGKSATTEKLTVQSSSTVTSVDIASGEGSGRIWFVALDGGVLPLDIDDLEIGDSTEVCPGDGMENVLGDLSSGVNNDPNPPNNNIYNFISLGSSANGLITLSTPTADGYIRHRAGNFNVYSDLFINTNGGSFPPISMASGTDNFITGLKINSLNSGIIANLPIDLNDNRIRDPNDNGDGDGGANRTQNFPVITGVQRQLGGNARIDFTFNSTPNSRFRLEFYRHEYLGFENGITQDTIDGLTSVEIMTDGNGNSTTTSITLTGADAERALFGKGSMHVDATRLNPPNDTSGDTSELSPPAAVPQPRFDFDNDGKTDISVYRPGATPNAESFWYILRSGDFTFRVVQFGIGEDKLVAGDYQGDGVADFAVFRPSTGIWYNSRITGNPSQNFNAVQWGLSTDVPVPGDYDADGANDQAVFRPSEGVWYIRRSLDGSLLTNRFGVASDKLVPADYNGDGQTDFAIYRNGQWWISLCAGCPAGVISFGLATDSPVPGVDFDGDGADDIAVTRNEGGSKIWHWLESGNGGYRAAQFGLASDKVLAGDFDADGESDLAVYRPAEGVWYILGSEQGFFALRWGASGDVPVPSAHLP